MASKVSGYIGKINPNNGTTQYSLGSTAYGYCETAAATAAKTVDMTGFTLIEGATIFIKFKYNNTSTNDPTLNVNSTGAKPLIPKTWYTGAILSLTYDGTSWIQANAYLDASVITSGTLPIARGGTGKDSWDINKITYASAENTLGQLAHASSTSYLLKSGSASAAPSWIQYTNANTASTIVQRDSSGNFSAGTITAALSGNATSATKANITTTTNAVAYYTNTTGTFGSKASANGALYATEANGSLSWGTLPVAQGGTGNTSYTANRMIYSESASKLSASGHYASSTALAINSTTNVIDNDSYNLYVNGNVLIHRDTTTADDLPTGINFSVTDTTTNKNYRSGGIFAYHDHHASSTYGVNMVIKSGGAMIIGGGEGPSNLYNVLHNAAVENNNGNLNTEASYFVTDGTTYIYSNANSIADRIGISLSTGGHILPQKAEAANDNVQNLGASNNRWANIYSAYTHSSTFYFGVPSFGGKSRAMLVYSPTYPYHGIWYFDEASDTMTLDVHGKANVKAEADLAIGALGAGIISTRNRYIPHTNNTTGTVGTQYIPVYVNAGTITQITANSVLTNLGSTTAASTYAASPRPGVTGTLPIANGGTGATTRLAAAKNLTNENVTAPTHVVGLTTSWGKFGVTTIAQLRAALGVPQMQIVTRTGTGTNSWSVSFNFAPDFISVLGYRGLDDASSYVDSCECMMANVTTSWTYVRVFTAGYIANGLIWEDLPGTLSPIQTKKSSDGKTFYEQINSTAVSSLPSDLQGRYGTGLLGGPYHIFNDSDKTYHLLAIKIT